MTPCEPMPFVSFVIRHASRRVFAVAVVAFVLVGWKMFFPLFTETYETIDPFITLATLGLTFFVWYQQMREEWEEDYLPKRLTVEFHLKNKVLMRCEKAFLAGESDIRALAQQIGSQMNNLKQLQFVAPAVEISSAQLNKKERFVHYAVKVHLTERPEALPENIALRIWSEPFLKEGRPFFKEVNNTDNGAGG